jgi:hypothetical protein
VPPEPFQTTVPCWECEATTDAPITVSIRSESWIVGTFALCPTCYRSAYLPLASDASGTLFVEAEGMDHRLARRARRYPGTG